MALNRRLPQSALLRRHRFVFAGPGRGGVAEEPQWALLAGAELEPPVRGDDQGVSWRHIHGRNGLGLNIWWTAPDLSSPLEHVPDFFHRAVPDRPAHLSGAQGDLNQATFLSALV